MTCDKRHATCRIGLAGLARLAVRHRPYCPHRLHCLRFTRCREAPTAVTAYSLLPTAFFSPSPFENENNRNNLSLERGLTRPRSTLRLSIAASYRQRKGDTQTGWSAHLFQLLYSGCSCCFQNPLVRTEWVNYADPPGHYPSFEIDLRKYFVRLY